MTDAPRPRYGLSLALFAATCASTTYVGGLEFSVPLMVILVCHEFGHYVAARIHRVPASLPYFVPLPLGPLGTLGAVILMPDRIRRRNALLDIGAAGPLAGMAVALPVLWYGLTLSTVGPASTDQIYLQEGHSLLYRAFLYAAKGPIPDGYDVHLHNTAFAGWAGLLVTMINLIPVAQLDGGHVAFALLGERQRTYSRRLRALLLPMGLSVCAAYGVPAFLEGERGEALWASASAGLPWIMWSLLLLVLVRGGGTEHPPTDPAPLSVGRKLVAIGTLVLFVLLFMPTWLRVVIPPGVTP